MPTPGAFVVPTFATGTTHNYPINAITTPPTRGLTGIETTNESTYLITFASLGDSTTPASGFELGGNEGHTGYENKFRTTCAATMIARDDPERNYGQPGTSHLHMFFCAKEVNAWTTYAALRNSGKANAHGGPLNNTAHWAPAFTKNNLGDGKTYAVRPLYTTIYYVNNNGTGTEAHMTARLANGLQWVSGAEMDDDWAFMDQYVTAANVGAPFRYTFNKPHVTYVCQDSTNPAGEGEAHNYLRNPGAAVGTGDPWGGRCTGSPAHFNIQIGLSDCWNGRDLWTPTGYTHVIPAMSDSQDVTHGACPTNYYRIPAVALQTIYEHNGPSDYLYWSLSSDAAFQAMLDAHPDATRHRTIGTGESYHWDYKEAWDPSIRQTWENKCAGSENGRSHLCDGSIISDTQQLGLGAESIQIPANGTVTPTSIGNMWLAPTSIVGPHDMKMHGMNDTVPPPASDKATELAGVAPLHFNLHGS